MTMGLEIFEKNTYFKGGGVIEEVRIEAMEEENEGGISKMHSMRASKSSKYL